MHPTFDEKAIFSSARRLTTLEERMAYLRSACAERPDALRRLLDLLRVYDESESFLEPPPVAANPGPDNSVAESPGTLIGPYKLMEQIGEGGMGLVFVAEQQQPVRRKVALKLIKPGMDTRQVVARFEAERQALALMDHPNIAKVLDGGETAGGRPFFVMELVKGVPITEFCDSCQAPVGTRLALFAHVCQAVQHAHQKGIIHRDIKPSNVLVMSQDGTPVVKVIDFGVAKAVGQQLTEKTVYTQFTQLIGSPLYMSPEQAGQSGLDVDTRSDIYSLGVLLYELLTGATPFEQERLKQAGYDEIRRIIREEDPPKPSTRISTLGLAATTISTNRNSDPGQLSRLIRGELDWIVMKCLEKDRNRRYETANALAVDLQRYLAGEPVLAAPASQWYRLRKLMRRRRGLVVAVALVLLTLLGGIAGTSWGMWRAKQERQSAVKERDAKDKALAAEQQARQQAFAALRSMTADVVERKFAQGTVLTDDDRAFLRGIIAQYDAFAAIQANDAESRAARAEGRHRVGTMRYRLGESKDAEADYRDALALYQVLAAEFQDRPELRQNLASVYCNLGNLLKTTGRPRESETAFNEALALQQQLVAEFSSRPEFRSELATTFNNFGILLNDTGRPKEAEKAYADALAIQKRLAADFPTRADYRQDVARSLNNLGVALQTTFRFADAEKAYAGALAIYKQLAADFPGQPEFRHETANNYDELGSLLFLTRRADRLAEAVKLSSEALAIFKQLAADFPTRPEFRKDLALCHNNLAAQFTAMGRLKEAETNYSAALAIYKRLVEDFPNQPDLQSNLAASLGNLALFWSERRDFKTAKAYSEEALPHHRAALQANSRNPLYRDQFRNGVRILVAANAGLRNQAAALQAARTLRDVGWDPAGDAHYAAHVLALCIPVVEKDQELSAEERKAAAQFYGDEAMKMLRDAVGKGWENAALYLAKDPALAPLRQRDDFKKLLGEVGKAPFRHPE